MHSSRPVRLAAACRLPLFALLFIYASALTSPVLAAGQRTSESGKSQASVTGTVVDPLGETVASAAVALLRDGQNIAATSSGPRGAFTFDGVPEGRYQIEVRASGFELRTTDAVFVGAGGHVTIEVGLQIGAVTQQVVVTASASEVPQSQVGAAITVLDSTMIEALGNTDLLEPLRTVPGATIVQAGGRGAATAIFVRGGASNFTKVLVDGVPANDIGGAFDLSDLATTGIERVEVMRGSNSVLYGSDALAGVINITTKRGQTRIPEMSVAIDGGNLSTSHEDASIGGAVKRFDYFGAFSHLQTDNSVPNSAYRNDTFATRLGVMLGDTTSLSGTVRHVGSDSGSPNAYDYYGIADDSSLDKAATYASIAAQSIWSTRWTSTVRFSVADQDYHYVNPSPTGLRSDPSSFANFLGNPVTITGADGRTVSGRAILDFSDAYPSVFDSSVTRRLLSGDTVFRLSSAFDLAGGVRVEHEHGSSGTSSKTSRNNSGGFVEARGAVRGYLYVNGGLGFDHNEIFGSAWTPRVSVAAYLRQPSSTAGFGDTKLTFNAGKGIKEPSIGQELSSLYAVIPAATANRLGIQAVGPERSRSVDVGVEQGLAGGHARLRVAYFNNEFFDLIEYVSKGVLPQLGVPVDAATASGFGAYVNSQSNKSSGLEMSAEAVLGPVKVVGAYTYVDATVTQSFSSSTLSPAINPAFPGITIGQYSPLVGARPFRRPANSGSVVASYTNHKVQASMAGYFVGKSDDSTFLSDEFFGYSMLLPNQDLDPAYRKFDLSGSYQIHPRFGAYLTIENAFDASFEAAAGFPALPRTVRAGVRVRF